MLSSCLCCVLHETYILSTSWIVSVNLLEIIWSEDKIESSVLSIFVLFCTQLTFDLILRPSDISRLGMPRQCFFCGPFLLFMPCACYAFSYVHCCLVVICWERADLLVLIVMINCVFFHFPKWYPGSGVVSWVKCGT